MSLMKGVILARHTQMIGIKQFSIDLTEKTQYAYSVYIDSLSTIPLSKFTDKIVLTHVYSKLGYAPQYIEHIKKLKKSWEVGNVSEDMTHILSMKSGKSKIEFGLNKCKLYLQKKVVSVFKKDKKDT